MWVQSLAQEDPLEEDMATHSRILAWEIPWTEEPDRLWSIGSQRVRHDWSDLAGTHTHTFQSRSSWSWNSAVELGERRPVPSNTPGPFVRTRGLTHSVSGGELLFLVYFVLSQIIHWLQLQSEKTKKSEEKNWILHYELLHTNWTLFKKKKNQAFKFILSSWRREDMSFLRLISPSTHIAARHQNLLIQH